MSRMVRRRSALRDFELQLAVCLFMVCALFGSSPARLEAAKLDTFLTSQDLAERVVLDQNGQQLSLPSAGDRHATLPKGSMPTYLAIPLNGGEHLPSTLPTLDSTASQGGTTVGPLNFDALFKIRLDATLDASRLAIVDTSSRDYLVEFLAARVHSSGTQSTSNPFNQVTSLLNTGSNQFSKLTQSGINELDKLLNISNTKSANTKPSLNLEAQLVGSPQAAPIPEPSTWLVFAGLIAGAAGLKFRRNIKKQPGHRRK